MKADKLKQVIAAAGGLFGALYLALQASGVTYEWFNPTTIEAWLNVANAGIPFALICYGVYKNQYLFSEKARKQERDLEERGLK